MSNAFSVINKYREFDSVIISKNADNLYSCVQPCRLVCVGERYKCSCGGRNKNVANVVYSVIGDILLEKLEFNGLEMLVDFIVEQCCFNSVKILAKIQGFL